MTTEAPRTPEEARAACERFREQHARLRAEVERVIVGMDEVVEQVLIALFAEGHVLLEGVPGLGKTLLVSTLARSLSLDFARIQFTPDVMPSDITGTTIVAEDHSTGERVFRLEPGPVFTQLLLADEINRASPKSQAALLEAMQERSVSVGGETRPLPRPFLVMATQNPIEQEGTYKLPEAQLDRFLLKILVAPTDRDELNEVLRRTTRDERVDVDPVLDAEAIVAGQRLARQVVIAPHVQDFAVRLVLASHPGGEHAPKGIERVVLEGGSPRAAQALVACARVRALLDGRFAASFTDIEAVAGPVLRHRVIRTFEAEAEGLQPDEIVDRLLDAVPRHLETARPEA